MSVDADKYIDNVAMGSINNAFLFAIHQMAVFCNRFNDGAVY